MRSICALVVIATIALRPNATSACSNVTMRYEDGAIHILVEVEAHLERGDNAAAGAKVKAICTIAATKTRRS